MILNALLSAISKVEDFIMVVFLTNTWDSGWTSGKCSETTLTVTFEKHWE